MNVSLKGNKYGLTVKISETALFSEVLEDIPSVFSGTEAMFGDEKIAIAFEGKFLTEAEKEELLETIAAHSKLNILCVLDFNSDTETRFGAAISRINAIDETKKILDNVDEEVSVTQDVVDANTILEENFVDEPASEEEVVDEPFDFVFPSMPNKAETKVDEEVDFDWTMVAKFYKGNVRSGLILEEETSLVIIGDINPGGEVISKGNIIVLGSLKGTAHAGSNGNNSCFVYANDMQPIQIRIGDILARGGDDRFKADDRDKNKGVKPRIAVVAGNSIVIQPTSKEVFDFIEI